jgi:hypothetical protein
MAETAPAATMEQMVRTLLTMQLDQERGRIIEKLVQETLLRKAEYGRKTLLDETLEWSVEGLVRQLIGEILRERKDEIMAALRARLDDAFFEKLLEKLTVGLERGLEITFKVDAS